MPVPRVTVYSPQATASPHGHSIVNSSTPQHQTSITDETAATACCSVPSSSDDALDLGAFAQDQWPGRDGPAQASPQAVLAATSAAEARSPSLVPALLATPRPVVHGAKQPQRSPSCHAGSPDISSLSPSPQAQHARRSPQPHRTRWGS